jgi:hypothetical protein
VWPLGPGSRPRTGTSCKRRAEARARPGHERVAVDAMALRHLADASHRVASYSPCQTAQFLHSRRILASGFSSFLFPPSSLPTPERGIGGAPGGVSLVRSRSNARRHASEAMAPPAQPGGPPHCAPPWRCRPRSRLRPRCRVRREGSTPPAAMGWLRCRAFRVRGYQPRSTPHPAPPSGSPRESAPHERDLRDIARTQRVVNI